MPNMRLYYMIENNGDGSAGIRWCDSEETASFLDENQTEGWGEPCTGSIEITGEPVDLVLLTMEAAQAEVAEAKADS